MSITQGLDWNLTEYPTGLFLICALENGRLLRRCVLKVTMRVQGLPTILLEYRRFPLNTMGKRSVQVHLPI